MERHHHHGTVLTEIQRSLNVGSTTQLVLSLTRLDPTDPLHTNQRVGVYRAHILEHFLPISKEPPNPLASTEC